MSQFETKTKFEYNGCTYDFDIADAEDAEKFEKALDAMKEDEQKLPKVGKLSEIYKGQCDMIKKFFDNCLGKNAGNAICTERSNVNICYDAYDQFLTLVRHQKEKVVNGKNVFSKYSNRQQRRNNKSASNLKSVK